MGQKVNPYGLRLGINKTWKSKWYVDPRDYANCLHEDLALRKALMDSPEARGAEIGDIEIIRQPQRITMMIYTARPGVIIGTKGANIEKIGQALQKLTDKKIQVKIKEVKKPEANAQIVALNIARQLKGRVAFRRVLKMTASNSMKSGVKGIKIKISGRLGGAEMARTQEVKEGRIPLHTLRADIDYGFAEANTTFGKIGVKVWVFKGEVYGHEQKDDAGLLVSRNQRDKASRS
ncbi:MULTISPECIES: 30S ribosomal protein S3 [unclassified Oceanispirochaeta]|uniref:30S ribosomal protein S3 n=1 Tax=unclassified Oceanispirochaeta TaxID=2635722 RepID=UPI000E08E819|nr:MULTISPECIES: 30S ribosomal protein S3 [unclassified Oceanispirochaeta]MBF9017135.1 30S ribosomal protein S3 [Oceanispirochaeta sp. M2]NPD73584.1 30S ribosomal protein S3 [Oceanispirochaeta sp. M1]RDG30688.1 30S ribosomal protein S3 [Oceanispirochaeta sp. M1]